MSATLPVKLLQQTALVSFFLLFACAASAAGMEISDFQIGFRGRYKAGFWTPVSFTVDPPGGKPFSGQLEIIAPDGDGTPVRFISDIRIAGQATVQRLMKTGRTKPTIEIRLIKDKKVVVRKVLHAAAGGDFPVALPGIQEMVLSIGGDIGVKPALELRRLRDELPTVAVQIKDNASLPANWLAYEAVDTVTIATGDLGQLDGLQRRHVDAIAQWVKMGGRLVLSTGSQAASLLEGDKVAGGGFRQLAPGKFRQTAPLRRTSAIENFAGNPRQALDSLAAEQRKQLELTLLETPLGVRLVEEGSGKAKEPVIIAAAHGFGVLQFVCIDLDTAPVSNWSGRPRMVLNLLYGRDVQQSRESSDGIRRQASHSGYNDISGQLRNALDQYQGVLLTPFSWVAAILGVYLLIIGPADYFLLKRFAPGMHFTWISFPLVVVLFCLAAVGLSLWRQGRPARVNQVDIVDICFDEQGQATASRGVTWANIYSPTGRRFDLKADAATAAASKLHGAALSWQGMTGDGLGSMGVNTVSVAGSGYAIDMRNSQFAVEGAPVQAASSKSFGLRWWADSDLKMRGRFRPNSSIDSLRNGIINPLDETLHDCQVYYRGWAYRFDKPVGPGEPLQIADAARERKLQWHLTRKVIDLNHDDTAEEWGDFIQSVPRILEVQMFHQAAGGRGYTQLHGRFQPYVDLSKQLNLNRAIVICRVKKPAIKLESGGVLSGEGDQQWTYYRFITPVTPQ